MYISSKSKYIHRILQDNESLCIKQSCTESRSIYMYVKICPKETVRTKCDRISIDDVHILERVQHHTASHKW